MNVFVDLLAKLFAALVMPVANCMQHQMQRYARSVTQVLSARSYRAFESVEFCLQFLLAARIQVELFLHSRCRFRK